jgi:hypothetical protein
VANTEEQTLNAPPAWTKPVFAMDFDAYPEGQPVVSPANPNPFDDADGMFRIRAHANTYAFLRIPMQHETSGFVVLLRQSTDAGMSWGPGAMLRWPDGSGLRLGVRSDSLIQADILGKQMVGGVYTTRQWVFLRARWTATQGVIESSADGTKYERVWTFTHGGALNRPAAELLFGKVPFNGQPQDYSEPGALGECEFDLIQVFGK